MGEGVAETIIPTCPHWKHAISFAKKACIREGGGATMWDESGKQTKENQKQTGGFTLAMDFGHA